ncbi:sugar ABC transporter permease [Amycolatopsis keratiniphila]|uniref:Cellobiose transport system permease protein n=1 Tax=Amycolatopsis keratiniphila TaxID=129921 RepID=R4T8P7_9PSEU|nr:sugar ABC transporter permease [Amycolatopsis keratiniphila]AGM06908.1 cellobiose transport system permease protein [Amycolatopsis keratiniphila]OLZ45807.1 ABC transporter permease [Amycolatopsis keratiniphila subsp. nogabecina]SDU14200.1 cellobiose ABC transporter membrane protein [Amycolatopsis keratiniphila]
MTVVDKIAPDEEKAGARTPPRPTLRHRLSRWDVKVSPYLYIAPFFVVFGIVGLFPLLYTAYVSLFSWEAGDDDPTFIGMDNFKELFADTQFWNALENTVSIFLLSSVPQLIIAVLLAALLSARIRGATGWRVGVLLPYAASLVALGIIFANLFGPKYGLVNGLLQTIGLDPVDWQAGRFSSHVAIAIMVNWRWTGYNALIVLAAMQAIPKELHEAALIDGAGTARRFFSITLPLLKPTLIFVTITSTIGGLQIFTEPKLFDAMPGSNNGGSSNQFQTVTLYLYQTAFENYELGYASAIAWVLFVIIVLIALVNFFLTGRLTAVKKK